MTINMSTCWTVKSYWISSKLYCILFLTSLQERRAVMTVVH